MRIAAFILALCVCAFMGETILLSARCIETDNKTTCSMCAKGAMPHCMKAPPAEKKQTQRQPNCMDCPMFSLATYSPIIFGLRVVLVAREVFTPLEINGLADYHALSWKPPDHGVQV